MTEDEALQKVRRIFVADGSEEEIHALVHSLVDEFPHALISNLIFYDVRLVTPEQVVAEAIRLEADYQRQNGKI